MILRDCTIVRLVTSSYLAGLDHVPCFWKRQGRAQVMEKAGREGTAVLAGGRVKGRLIVGILITPRATDPARTGRRQRRLPIKWLQPPCPRGYSSALCTGRPLAGGWQRDSRGDQAHRPFWRLKVCVTERSESRGEGLSVPIPPARPLWDFWTRPSPSKGELKNFLRKP